MGESTTLTMAKMVMTLGLIVAIATIMPGAPANPGWSALQTTISTGFPSFNNPFQGQSATVDLTPAPVWNGGNASVYPPPNAVVGSAFNCSAPAWWNCVQDPGGEDGNASATFGRLVVNLTSISMWSSGLISYGTVSFWCRATGSVPEPIQAIVGDPTGPAAIATVLITEGYSNACLPGDYTRVVANLVSAGGTTLYDIATSHDPNLLLDIRAVDPSDGSIIPGSVIEITTAAASVYITGASASCGGGNFFTNLGCQLAQVGQFLINLGLFIVNGAIFLGLILGWIVTVLFEFIGAILFAMGWPLTIGAPPIVAAFLSVVVFGMYAYVFIWIVSLVRGTGSGVQ